MKKLMIALAAVAVAAGVQAASVDWASQSDSNFKGYNGEKLATTMPVYLIDSAYIDTIEAAIKAGTLSTSTQGVIAQGAFTNTRGNIDDHPVSNDALVYDKGDTKYSFAQLIIDNKNGAEGEIWYNISQAYPATAAYDPTKTGEFAETGVTFDYSMFSTDNSQTGGWKMAAVPEPTSGLLLLLGMAGLALRRRRRA